MTKSTGKQVGSILNYFEKRRLEDHSFHISLHLDDDGLITNVFCADAKMIVDYNAYGDVVSFDTTFRTNKNYRSFCWNEQL